jgi:hypothetical protein
MAHAISKVDPKGCTGRLKPIQHVNNYGAFTGIVPTELQTERAPEFLSDWCSRLGTLF